MEAAQDQACVSDGEARVTIPGFAPELLHVVAHKGGALAVDVEAPMTYTQRQPNGPNCSPTCSIGTFTVALDASAKPTE